MSDLDPQLAMPSDPVDEADEDEPDPAEDLVAPDHVRDTDRGDGPEADLVVTEPEPPDPGGDSAADRETGGSRPG